VRPGGYVLADVDNPLGLHHLLDPRLNPAPASLRRSFADRLHRTGILHTQEPTAVRLDAVLARLGLEQVRSTSVGFGPFTYWKRSVLSEPEGMRLHRRLQRLADRGVPLVRSTGAKLLVLARKPDAARPGSAPVADA
jgi:hypothetical protein